MPTREATDRLAAEMKDASRKTVWMSGCKSWYLDGDGNPALYPWAPSRFYEEMRQSPDFCDYDVRQLDRKRLADAA